MHNPIFSPGCRRCGGGQMDDPATVAPEASATLSVEAVLFLVTPAVSR